MIRKNISDSDDESVYGMNTRGGADSQKNKFQSLQQLNYQVQSDNEHVVQLSSFQPLYEVLNPYKNLKVTGPIWSKDEGGSSGYRQYKIETHFNGYGEPVVVCRRYKDIDWLYNVLRVRYPYCIIPPIPPKNAIGHWKSDESEHIKQRRIGIEKFLIKMINHKRMCGSEDLKGFLSEQDHQFEKRKKETKEMIPDIQDKSYSQIAYTTVQSYFSSATTTLGSYIWSSNNNGGGVGNNSAIGGGNMSQVFGTLSQEAEQEINRFNNQEQYLKTLTDCFNQLEVEINKYIDCTAESSKNYSNLAENFSSLSTLKGVNIDELQSLSKEVSTTFSQASFVKKEEMNKQMKGLREPIEDFKQMIISAQDACLRRKDIVCKYYQIRYEAENLKKILSHSSSKDFEQKLFELTKKSESLTEEVASGSKILEEEIKIFRRQKEVEMQRIMTEFVQIQKETNERMQNHWQHFVNSNASLNAANLETSFTIDQSKLNNQMIKKNNQ